MQPPVEVLLEHEDLRVARVLVDLVDELAALVELLDCLLHALCRRRHVHLLVVVRSFQLLEQLLLPFVQH